MANISPCSSPKGPLYCTDKKCPARDKDGNHIVMVHSEDLSKGLQERLAKKQVPSRPVVNVTPKAEATLSQTLFDFDNEWYDGGVSFATSCLGMEAAFHAETNVEPVVAKIEGGKKRDVYIVAKGTLRIEYGKHIIRSTSKLVSIGINTDKKLERAVAKGLITITQQPKFEAVDIRYMGRKDESRTPLGISSGNLATVLFETMKYLSQD